MKKPKKQPINNEILALRQDANGIANILGLTAARIHQMRREGGLKPDSDGLYGVVDALRCHYLYDSPRGDAMRARTRQTNARALELEQGTRRAQRRMFVLDEVRQIAGLVFETAIDVVDAESSRIYHEYLHSHTEDEARIRTAKLHDLLRGIVDAWGAGVMQLCRDLDKDHLPDGARLDYVLAELIAAITARNEADEKQRAKPPA